CARGRGYSGYIPPYNLLDVW
nr:immunoglobulin heavy chain junction region [Macaca mulatta]MOV48843.1 immunoglobulin heavy chain junction region [Macaca mulatta]MOV48854.1 immunoglobulin heavy chain junction region [Macaca mulatta]MOV48878.1 immunoglobulin heavy chain junction region [Macaca mulatta]MOV48933.1 immunoglobulin heavy chain junction region [Macaca mulatta]